MSVCVASCKKAIPCSYVPFIHPLLFSILILSQVLNVAVGKAAMQSSTVGQGAPQRAIDGSTSTFYNQNTCTMTEPERASWWYVNLLEPYLVQLARIDFGQSCCGKNLTLILINFNQFRINFISILINFISNLFQFYITFINLFLSTPFSASFHLLAITNYLLFLPLNYLCPISQQPAGLSYSSRGKQSTRSWCQSNLQQVHRLHRRRPPTVPALCPPNARRIRVRPFREPRKCATVHLRGLCLY